MDQFSIDLQKALEEKRKEINEETCVELTAQLRKMAAYTRHLYAILVNADIIKDAAELTDDVEKPRLPASEPLSEAAIETGLAVRLFDLIACLDYASSKQSLTSESLTVKEIQSLLSIVRYVDWPGLSPASASYMTGKMSGLINKINANKLSAGLTKDVIGQLSMAAESAAHMLEYAAVYAKEAYKNSVRTQEFRDVQNLSLSGEEIDAATDETIKRLAASKFKPPIYRDLIKDVWEEQAGATKEQLREAVLLKLTTKAALMERESQLRVKKVNPKRPLVAGFLELGKTNSGLITCLAKLKRWQRGYEEERDTFFHKIARLLGIRKPLFDTIYEVSVPNPFTGESERRPIKFSDFCKSTEELTTSLEQLTGVESLSIRKAYSLPMEAMEAALNRRVHLLRECRNEAAALTNYFKERSRDGDNSGIALEIRIITGSLETISEHKAAFERLKAEYDVFLMLEESASSDSATVMRTLMP